MRPQGVLIGRIFSTDIYATGGFLLLMVLFLAMNPENIWLVAIWILALIVSVLVHEFGHVFAVRWLLKGPSIVMLWGLGGLCIHEPTPVIRKRIGISLMGPAFGFTLGLLFLGLRLLDLPGSPVVKTFVDAMVWINLFYNALNLLPVIPLDGGQASLAALEARIGPAKALYHMRRISVFVSAIGVGVAAYFGYIFLTVLAGLLLIQNLSAARHGV